MKHTPQGGIKCTFQSIFHSFSHTHTLTHSGVNQIIWRKSLSVMSTGVTSRESCNSMRLDSCCCGKTNHQTPQHFEKKTLILKTILKVQFLQSKNTTKQ